MSTPPRPSSAGSDGSSSSGGKMRNFFEVVSTIVDALDGSESATSEEARLALPPHREQELDYLEESIAALLNAQATGARGSGGGNSNSGNKRSAANEGVVMNAKQAECFAGIVQTSLVAVTGNAMAANCASRAVAIQLARTRIQDMSTFCFDMKIFPSSAPAEEVMGGPKKNEKRQSGTKNRLRALQVSPTMQTMIQRFSKLTDDELLRVYATCAARQQFATKAYNEDVLNFSKASRSGRSKPVEIMLENWFVVPYNKDGVLGVAVEGYEKQQDSLAIRGDKKQKGKKFFSTRIVLAIDFDIVVDDSGRRIRIVGQAFVEAMLNRRMPLDLVEYFSQHKFAPGWLERYRTTYFYF